MSNDATGSIRIASILAIREPSEGVKTPKLDRAIEENQDGWSNWKGLLEDIRSL
jgi:hypothetical protein